MKIFSKAVLSALTAALLSSSLAVSAFAADSSVTFNGHGKGFDFAPGSTYSETDLFDGFKDAMPGDTLTETITVTNDSADCDYVKLYVRAEAHDEEENPLTESVSAAGETVSSMTDFLSQLHMKVYNGEDLIFNASPDELDGMAQNVLLGSFDKGESTTLTVELSVPVELSNEYASRVGEVDWVFTAESFDNPEPPAEDELIQTGANNMPVLVLSVLGASLIALGAIVISKKKENDDA